MSVLRAGLLAGRRVTVTGIPEAVRGALEGLGARVETLAVDGEAPSDTQALLFDGRPAFAAGGLTGALDGAWEAVRAVADGLIERSEGRLILVAPAPDAGRFAEAARAGLENLARTLSVEWARYGITACAVLPGPACSDAELAELIAFLLSAAGEYFSGCGLRLGDVAVRALR